MTEQLIALDENAVAFPVNFAPAQIDFSGYNQMKDQIDQLHESLEGYVVTKDNLKESKSTRAKLNKLKKAKMLMGCSNQKMEFTDWLEYHLLMRPKDGTLLLLQ